MAHGVHSGGGWAYGAVSTTERPGEELPGEPRMATFVLRLRLGAHDPPSGSISRFDQTTSFTFNGWMDLMAAVNQLRDQADDALD